MNKQDYVLAIDCGTTGNRAIVLDKKHNIKASFYQEFNQYYPKPGWVEHDAQEIWKSVLRVTKKCLSKVNPERIRSIGITNQRETIVVWDPKTGKPAMPAIVWQCRRSADICKKHKKKGIESRVHRKTGLFLDPYFSGTKIEWIIKNRPSIASGLKNRRYILGTIDTWIIWNLSAGKTFVTDVTNASRTLLYNIRTNKWDKELCKLFKVPMICLPKVVSSCSEVALTEMKVLGRQIPIAGVAGDQQSAAFAQGCSPGGIIKNTYGTGLFVVAHIGHQPKVTKELITTVAASEGSKIEYALEASIFIGGAAIQWLRDGLRVLESADQSAEEAASLDTNDGVYFVPALAGLGCPYWDPSARGVIVGLSRQTTKKHIIRAALESMAFQTCDAVNAMQKNTGIKFKNLMVDGGAVKNNFLMQFQASVLGVKVVRPTNIETTALGAAALAGIATSIWKNRKDFLNYTRIDRSFNPTLKKASREKLYGNWLRAVERSKRWVE